MKDRDYSKYSLADLREALSTVDGLRYPQNKAALEEELQRRIDSGEVERESRERERRHAEQRRDRLQFARQARPWIGIYLMLSSPLLLLSMNVHMPESVGWATFVVRGLGSLYIVAATVAGFGLWKDKTWGHTAAVGALLPQTIQLQSSFLLYSLTPAIAGFVYIAGPGTFEIGVSAHLNTGALTVAAGELALPFTIGVNLVAAFLLTLLFRARMHSLEQRPDAENRHAESPD